MIKHLLALFFLFLFAQKIGGQIYPPYTVNICSPASSGYYFFNTLPNSAFVQGPPYSTIMDSTGKVIYFRAVPNSGGDFTLQPDGRITFAKDTMFMIMDSTFSIVDSVRILNGIRPDMHELQILPGGNFLMLGYEYVQMDLSAYQYFGPFHNAFGSSTAWVKCGVIQEQDPNYQVVFEWHAKDHFSFSDVAEMWLFNPNNVDWTHCNALELDDDGNILLSSRHLNEITKINRADSSVIWRMGGNANQFTFTNDAAMFIGQHDIRRIANGNITIWDNGAANPFHPGKAKEYAIDEVNHTATLAWSYTESPAVHSNAIGNVQRLPNGNTLIDYGMTPTEPRMFDVVDPSGNIVFELQFADSLRSYRAFNYLSLPWHLPRTQISCVQINNQYYLDAGTGYARYFWSTGDTTQMIPVTSADTFSVFVPCGDGGYMRSEEFIVTNINAPCATETGEKISAADFSVSPNPADKSINVELQPGIEYTIDLIDIYGRSVHHSQITGSALHIDCSLLSDGLYFVRINDHIERFVVVHQDHQ